jgi:hypothetical protein
MSRGADSEPNIEPAVHYLDIVCQAAWNGTDRLNLVGTDYHVIFSSFSLFSKFITNHKNLKKYCEL